MIAQINSTTGQMTSIATLGGGYIGPLYNPVLGNLYVSGYYVGNRQTLVQITLAGAVSTFVSGVGAPTGLGVDQAGNMYVSSYSNCPAIIFKVTPQKVVTQFGTGLCKPDGIAVDSQGNVFVANRGTGAIMEVPPTGGSASVFATGFSTPIALAFDKAGNLFVADYTKHAIFAITPSKSVTLIDQNFSAPVGVVFDKAGNLYVADALTGNIVKIVLAQ